MTKTVTLIIAVVLASPAVAKDNYVTGGGLGNTAGGGREDFITGGEL